MPLVFADMGIALKIQKIGGQSETRRHLNNLGFVEGAEISVISKALGNLIVCVKESRIAISIEMASKIVVGNI